MHRYFLIFLLSIFTLPIVAENVTNVRVRQEDKSIIITYDLSKKSDVRVFYSTNNNRYYTELKAVIGNVGKSVPAGQNRKIVWKPLEENETFIAENVRFKVEATSLYEPYATKTKVKTVIMGQAGYSFAPQLSYGGMIGQMYKGVGWFVSGRSNFKFPEPAKYICNENGVLEDYGGVPFYTGNYQTTHWAAYGGFMMNFLEWSTKNKFNTFGFYVGGGYGKRELQLELTNGQWVTYKPTSFENGGGNAGLFFSVYGVTLHAGASTIGFEYLEIEAGIGFMF